MRSLFWMSIILTTCDAVVVIVIVVAVGAIDEPKPVTWPSNNWSMLLS